MTSTSVNHHSFPYLSSNEPISEETKKLVQQEADSSTGSVEAILEDILSKYTKIPDYTQNSSVFQPSKKKFKATSVSKLLPPVLAKQNKLQAWETSLDQAAVALELETNHKVNLQLMQRFGAQKWKAHAEKVELEGDQAQEANNRLEAKIEACNKQRQFEQAKVGPRLESLETKWGEATKKMFLIRKELAK